MSICGLDFGTSNTTLGTIAGHGRRFWRRWRPIRPRSPARFSTRSTARVLIGRKAIEAYVEGAPGRLMRSLKSVLGTSLIDETTQLGRERTSFRDVIAYYLGAVKRRAEQAADRELRDVVHGRPVHSSTTHRIATARRRRRCGRSPARSASTTITFQFEPIAAALDYERQINSKRSR